MSGKTKHPDPNGPGIKGNLFGLPYSVDEAQLVILPIPWEVTVSYHEGTADGPLAVRDASSQIDWCFRDIPDIWTFPMAMLPVPQDLYQESKRLRGLAAVHISALEKSPGLQHDSLLLEKINSASENLNIYVRSATQKLLQQGKMVGVLGGDHSTPLGFLRALNDVHDKFGILQIDAHADLRRAYEGFVYSHASIMQNALKLPSVKRLVQVGIRSYCDEEIQLIKRSMGRVKTFFDQDLKEQFFQGKTWNSMADSIINELPEKVYISFDIDGLDPKLCPHTGTPVPGGLEFDQATYLLRKLVKSGRKIIGFDLCEVGKGITDWDANVGAQLLFHLCALTGVSNKKLKLTD